MKKEEIAKVLLSNKNIKEEKSKYGEYVYYEGDRRRFIIEVDEANSSISLRWSAKSPLLGVGKIKKVLRSWANNIALRYATYVRVGNGNAIALLADESSIANLASGLDQLFNDLKPLFKEPFYTGLDL